MDEWILHGPQQGNRVPRLSLGEYYLTRLQEHGEKVAMVQTVDGSEVPVTYSELLRRGKIVSGVLRARGVGVGDTVMLICGNTLDFPPIMLGTLFVGAALAPVNQTFNAYDMLQMLGEIQPKIVISNKVGETSIHDAKSKHKTPVEFMPMDMINRCWGENSTVPEDFRVSAIDDTDSHVALVMCSCGTTGKPKGVEITHKRWLNVLCLDTFPREENVDQVVLNMSGPFWMTSQILTLYALCSGYKMVLLETFQVEDYFSIIHKYKVTLTILGPEQLMCVAQYPSTQYYDLLSLRTVIYTGSPMRQPMLELAEKKLRCPIVILYGLSECTGHIRPAYGVYFKPGTVGKLGDRMVAKVVDIETGKLLGPDCEGEICIQSPTVFKGYRGNPQATKERFDEEGFLHTGDVGHYDKDGFFYVNDRIKELFKFRGIHVSGISIEEVLLQHPAVLEAAVVGIPHEADGAHATAFVVLKQGVSVTGEDLTKRVQAKLPDYKWLYGGVRFLDSLPKTASGKIRKYELRKLTESL